MKILCTTAGFLVLFAAEILRIYFIMPFPGSQHGDTVPVAYWLHNNIGWLRLSALAILAIPLGHIARKGKKGQRVAMAVALSAYAAVFFLCNFRFEADAMFYQPSYRQFAGAGDTTIAGNKLVIGVVRDGEAKAYPIQLIGYHHQVRDTVGQTPVMVTYCTVCRTGRVYSPVVDGKPQTFRLVGMDHFNAMFEDAGTKSWWQQATGVAITGPQKGKSLPEIPSQQMTWSGWLAAHPNSVVMLPDTTYRDKYKELEKYDDGSIKSSLEHRDTASWHVKSWIIGVVEGRASRAYDWNELLEQKVIQDSLPGLPLLIIAEPGSSSSHVFSRNTDSLTLRFARESNGLLTDINTGSSWSFNGHCTAGMLKGKLLAPVQAYQEFWHSWQAFHPNTSRYDGR